VLDPTRDKILYEVATAHLDTQWNWTIRDTINSYLPSTLTKNFNLFEKYPHYVFSFEGAFRYKLAKEYYPAEYATLGNYIAQGRWRVAGSAVDAGDVNVPSPESLMRHILYGNGFWKSEFGKTSADVFLPDCFGFGYALPSVAAHCGLNGFSSQKLSWGSAVPVPFNIGRWVGPDGASVVAALDPGGYGSSISDNLANDQNVLNRINAMGASTGLYIDYRYFGTGDTGGSPSDSSVNWLEQSVTTSGGLVNVLSAASDQLFRDLTPAHVSRLPVYRGELLMRTHGTGCYTSHPEMKKYNRQNELRADAAERISVMADWLQGGGTYPQEKLNNAWERFLWHQFHDDLTGTSIPAAYTFSWNDELLSLNEFASAETHGAGILAEALDTTAVGVPLVVYNPLAAAREDIVEATVNFSDGVPAAVRVFDPSGNEVPSQMGNPTGNSVPVTFLASVPANGAAVLDVRPSAIPCQLDTGLSVSTSQIENSRYRVQINAAGDVTSIYDKVNNRELLNAPIRWEFLYDISTSWPAWEILYSTVTGSPLSYLGSAGAPMRQVLENGPARAAIGITRFNAGSAFTERLRLASGAAGDRVEWDVSINWGTPQTLLKVVFPLSVANPQATYDLGLGTIQRANDTPDLYEVPAQQWADLTSSSGDYGVTVMNDSKYGWDKPDDRTLRLTILHTPAVGGGYVYQATNGFGPHRLTFAVMGHTVNWSSVGAPWVAARVNQPLQAFQTLPHAGVLGKSFGFLSCDNSNVMVKAIKKAENSNEIIVRLQELSGQPQTATLSCAGAITTARLVTGAEDPLSALTPSGGTVSITLGAYQPRTLALTIAPAPSTVAQPQSSPFTLPFNLDAISPDANRTDGNFDSGYTYPAELIPPAIQRDGITFQLGPTNNGALNALACQGQTLSIPASYDRLYFLAAAASNDITAPFLVNGQAQSLTIPYFSGFIGQWNPPFLKHQEIGWVCTHRHTGAGANDAYRFCYFFKLRLDLPPGPCTVTLPNSPNVRIFAASAAFQTTADTTPAGGTLAENLLPWANAGPDRTVNADFSGTTQVSLDATSSLDPDGSIVSYSWTENDLPLATGAQPVVPLAVGTHTLVLTVTDNRGGSSQDLLNITVLVPLNVTLSASPTNSSSAPLVVQFNASASGGAGTGPYDTTDDGQGTITAQGENPPNEVAADAFDNDPATKWLDFANANPDTRASWIQYQFDNGLRRVVTNYTITAANDAPERDPADWQLLGSNDGNNWTTLDVRTGQTFDSRFKKRAFSVATPGAYNYYRLQIDSVAGPGYANSVQLSEIELLGAPTYAYWWNFGDGTSSTAQNPQHIYTDTGAYTVVIGVHYGIYSGTNSIVITVGTPLAANFSATPLNGLAPLLVHFIGQATGGRSLQPPYDTTDDRLGIITAQGENAGYGEVAANAFDNNSGTKWLDFANAYPSTRSSWIQYQYPNGLRYPLTQYTVTSANDYPFRDPADWRLRGSNDGGATWITLDTQTGQDFPSRFQKLAYPVTNPSAFNLYRFQIDSVANPGSANSVQLSELEFITTPPRYSYSWNFGDGAVSTLQNPDHIFASNGVYTVTLIVSDGLSPAYSQAILSVALPGLSFALPADDSLQLSWPTWTTNYSFQVYSTTNLAPGTIWEPMAGTVVTSGTNLTVTVPIGPGNRFFRLQSP